MSEKLNYGHGFQIKTISCLLTDRSFLQQVSDILLPEFFESESNQWIVDTILKYFQEYGSAPTLDVFKIKFEEIEREVVKVAVVDSLKEAYKYLESNDLDFVKEKILTFCKNQCIKSAILESVELLRKGEYDSIKKSIDTAMKAGANRDIGYEFMKGIQARYTDNVRNTIPTCWPLINDLAGGGFGKGELIIFVAPPGIGKCVGPNTSIDIEYEELGLELKNSQGNPFTLWINPFDTYSIDTENIPGWKLIEYFKDISRDCDIKS